jgi:allantoate deiminase
MNLRRDALTGAAEWIGAVERIGKTTAGLVATVGRFTVEPGAGNIVPGKVTASLDVRHAFDAIRLGAVERLFQSADEIAEARGLRVATELLLDQSAVPCDTAFSARLDQAIATAGYPGHIMVSGAGHDAMVVAPHMPMAMLFLRSPGGISHHPDENVLVADVAAAVETGLALLAALDKEF